MWSFSDHRRSLSLSLAFAANPTSPSSVRACSTAEIVANGVVTQRQNTAWPDYPKPPMPSPAELAAAHVRDMAGAQLAPETEGLSFEQAIEIDWPNSCSVSITGLVGSEDTTDQGLNIGVQGQHVVVGNPAAPVTPEREPYKVGGARFVASTSVAIADWRVGAWQHADGSSTVDAFRPNSSAKSIPVLRSALPIVGISYLPAPDTGGGMFTVLQRLAPNRYRWCSVSWGEKAIRELGFR
jgi:hypothetical protein